MVHNLCKAFSDFFSLDKLPILKLRKTHSDMYNFFAVTFDHAAIIAL